MMEGEEEMITLHYNVMSVELAITRELEFRRKMDFMRKRNPNEFKPVVPLQEPSPCQTERKRKAPANNSQSFSIQKPSSSIVAFLKQPGGLGCRVCQLMFDNLFHLKKHCESEAHKIKSVQMKKRGDSSNPMWCEICKLVCSSGIVMEQHLSGQRHAAALQAFEQWRTGIQG